MNRSSLIVATLLCTTVLAACGEDAPGSGVDEAIDSEFRSAGVSVHYQYAADSDVAAFRVEVSRDGEPVTWVDVPVAGPVAHDGVVFGGTRVSPHSGHLSSSVALEVEPGAIDVMVTPLRVASPGAAGPFEPSVDCGRARVQDVQVVAGETTHVEMISQCDTAGNGGIAPEILVNRSPRVSLAAPSTLAHECYATRVCASFSDPDNDPMRMRWHVGQGADRKALQSADGQLQATSAAIPVELTPAQLVATADGVRHYRQCIEIGFDEPGAQMVGASVYDLLADGQTIESQLAAAGSERTESHAEAHLAIAVHERAPAKCIDADGQIRAAGGTLPEAIDEGCSRVRDADFYCDVQAAQRFGFELDTTCPQGQFAASAVYPACDAGTAWCGNAIVDPGEECDLGALNDERGDCLPSCQSARCGDGFVHELGTGTEQCDRGPDNSPMGVCNTQCRTDGCTDPAGCSDEACADEPCDHGACQPSADDYRCVCDPGWQGRNCDTPDPCHDDPCERGTCRVEAQGFACDCDPGWSGTRCDVPPADDPPVCAADSCENGRCEVLGSAITCDCAFGWEGERCDRPIDDPVNPCDADPCGAQGVCSARADGFECRCLPGWTGETCDDPIETDACAARPCGPHAEACTNLPDNAFVCRCAPGWGGPRCDEAETDHCEEQPCEFGHCESRRDGFVCDCFDGYGGERCDEAVGTTNPTLAMNDCVVELQASGGWTDTGDGSYEADGFVVLDAGAYPMPLPGVDFRYDSADHSLTGTFLGLPSYAKAFMSGSLYDVLLEDGAVFELTTADSVKSRLSAPGLPLRDDLQLWSLEANAYELDFATPEFPLAGDDRGLEVREPGNIAYVTDPCSGTGVLLASKSLIPKISLTRDSKSGSKGLASGAIGISASRAFEMQSAIELWDGYDVASASQVGHLYVGGTLPLKIAGLPLALRGDAVVDVDPLRNGWLDPRAIDALMTGRDLDEAVEDLFESSADFALLANADLSIKLPIPGDLQDFFADALNIDTQLAAASLHVQAYSGGGLRFRGVMDTNPMDESIIRDFFPNGGTAEAAAYYHDPENWGLEFDADMQVGGIGYTALASIRVDDGDPNIRLRPTVDFGTIDIIPGYPIDIGRVTIDMAVSHHDGRTCGFVAAGKEGYGCSLEVCAGEGGFEIDPSCQLPPDAPCFSDDMCASGSCSDLIPEEACATGCGDTAAACNGACSVAGEGCEGACEFTQSTCEGGCDLAFNTCDGGCESAFGVCDLGCDAAGETCEAGCNGVEDTCDLGCDAAAGTCDAACDVEDGVCKGACETTKVCTGACDATEATCKAGCEVGDGLCGAAKATCNAGCEITFGICKWGPCKKEYNQCRRGCSSAFSDCTGSCRADCESTGDSCRAPCAAAERQCRRACDGTTRSCRATCGRVEGRCESACASAGGSCRGDCADVADSCGSTCDRARGECRGTCNKGRRNCEQPCASAGTECRNVCSSVENECAGGCDDVESACEGACDLIGLCD